MTSSCPRCFAPLNLAESPGGLCPKCLLSVAMGEDAVIRSATGEPVSAPPTIAELAPHFPQLDLHALIGRGGGGAVYRAVQRDLGRPVALKVLLLDPENDPSFGERFVREAQAMATLAHPNVAGVYDAGRAGPYWYLLIELVEGPNLRQLIQERDLSPGQALDIVRQICSALEYAHGEGIVHRDVKPENVLVDGRGRVKLVDFGLAKLLRPELSQPTLTRSSQTMGTWHYMAPEQLRRPLEVDHRADIYSLGVVLYELLTGEVPQGRYAPASQRANTDRRVDAIVDRALEQDPARRYQEARGVREDVERLEEPVRGCARDGRRRSRAHSEDGVSQHTFAIGFVTLVLLVLFAVFMIRTGEGTREGATGELVAEPTVGLTWSTIEELGLEPQKLGFALNPISTAAVSRLLAARAEYEDVEQRHTYRVNDRFVVHTFDDERTALAESVRADTYALAGQNYRELELQLFPFGREGYPVTIYDGGERVTQGRFSNMSTDRYEPGAIPVPIQRFIQRTFLNPEFQFSYFTSGFPDDTRATTHGALIALWRDYVEIEREHSTVREVEEGTLEWRVEPFPEERALLLERYGSILRGNRPRRGNDPAVELPEATFPYGLDADVLTVELGDGSFEIRGEKLKATLPSPGWMFERFATTDGANLLPPPRFERHFPGAENLPLAREFLDEDDIEALDAVYADYLALEAAHASREGRNLRAMGGRFGPRHEAVKPPRKGYVDGLRTHVAAFPEEREALVERLCVSLVVPRDQAEALAARMLFLGERDVVVHAGTWSEAYFVVVSDPGDETHRTHWGGREIPPRFRRFFAGFSSKVEPIIQDFMVGEGLGPWGPYDLLAEHEVEDVPPVAGHWLHGSPTGLLEDGLDLAFPTRGAALLLGDAPDPDAALVERANAAWERYAELLGAHTVTTAWSVDGRRFLQVDVAPFADGYEAWLADLGPLRDRLDDLDLPGRIGTAQLRIDEDGSAGVYKGAASSRYAVFQEVRENAGGWDTVQVARPFPLELLDALWPSKAMPPASFTMAALEAYEGTREAELASLVVRLHPHERNTVEIEVPADRERFFELARGLEAVHADGLRLYREAFPLLEHGGRVLAAWDQGVPAAREVNLEGQSGGTTLPLIERLLTPDGAESAELFAPPEELGLPADLPASARWAVARARWEYVDLERTSSGRLDLPKVTVPERHRTLSSEGPVITVRGFEERRREVLDVLARDLQRLGVDPVDTSKLEAAIAPLGEEPVHLAVRPKADAGSEIWLERVNDWPRPGYLELLGDPGWRWRHLLE